MSETHDWPMERTARGPNRRPWIFSATGFVGVLFRDAAEAQRARDGLMKDGVPDGDIRLYLAEEILANEERFMEERSLLAKAVAASFGDSEGRRIYLENAEAGGAALWLYAPTDRDAKRLLHQLADYKYFSLRYFDDEGVKEIGVEDV
jgi:hypothetical protein